MVNVINVSFFYYKYYGEMVNVVEYSIIFYFLFIVRDDIYIRYIMIINDYMFIYLSLFIICLKYL